MGNDCAPSCDLLVRREERLAKNRFHVRPGGLPVASTRGPVVYHVAEQCLCSGRPFPDAIAQVRTPKRTTLFESRARPVQLPPDLEARPSFRVERLAQALDFVFPAVLVRVAHFQSARRGWGRAPYGRWEL